MRLLSFHPVAWSVIIGTFLTRGVFFMVYPFLAIYLHRVIGLPAFTIGVILGISSLVGTVASFVGGLWSDRLGRYPVMLGSIFALCLVFVGFGFAHQAWLFLILNALNGLFRNTFEPTARALLADLTPAEQKLSVFSARYYAINVGGAVGPLLGSYLGSSASTSPFYWTALVYALYGCVLAYLSWRYREQTGSKWIEAPEPIELRQAMRVIATDRFFRRYLLASLFVFAAFSHLETTVPQYMGNTPTFPDGVHLYAYLFVVNACCVLLLQIPLTKWAQRFEPLTMVKVGGVAFALSLLGFGVATSFWMLVAAMVLFSVGEILSFVVGEVVIDRHAPEGMRGTYFGASGLQFFGQGVGPWIGGALLQWLGYGHGPLIFLLLCLMTLLALPMYQWAQRQKAKGVANPDCVEEGGVVG